MLDFGHQVLSWAEIRAGQWPQMAEWEEEALGFCRDWLGGQASFVLHTSGSTGAPKPIAVPRARMEASALGTGEALGIKAGDKALCCLPVRYIAGKMMLVRAMVLDLHLHIRQPSEDPLAGWPPEEPIHFVALIPMQLRQILASGSWQALRQAKAVIIGGGAVPPAVEVAARAVPLPLWATYGMTETVSHVALRALNGTNGHAEAWYQLLPGVEAWTDERGCLCLRGAVTGGEPVLTNDLVTLEGRRFRWLGRHDLVINSGGIKIIVEEWESKVSVWWQSQGLNAAFALVGVPDERLGEQVVLAVEQTGEPMPDLLLGLRELLPPYQAPRQIVWLSAWPLTPTGKPARADIQREVCRILEK